MGKLGKHVVIWFILSLITISLGFITVSATPVEDEDLDIGDFSWAYAYVAGEVVGSTIHATDRAWGWWVDPNYPYGGYVILNGWPPICDYDACIYTSTEVKLYNAWGELFTDSYAYAVVCVIASSSS